MTISVTLHAWYAYLWLAIGAIGYVPYVLVAESHMAGPRNYAQAFWPRYQMDTRAKRVRRNVTVTVAGVVAWPLAWWEVLR